jgi:hypothetical protein
MWSSTNASPRTIVTTEAWVATCFPPGIDLGRDLADAPVRST